MFSLLDMSVCLCVLIHKLYADSVVAANCPHADQIVAVSAVVLVSILCFFFKLF